MQGGTMKPILRSAGLFGVVIGIAGSILDFYSGYRTLGQSTPAASDMAMGNSAPGLAWGIGIIGLGFVLLVTSFASMLPTWANNMKGFGALMVVYGFVMLLIGVSMYLGLILMSGAFSPALGMLAVGVLMAANGVFMTRSHM